MFDSDLREQRLERASQEIDTLQISDKKKNKMKSDLQSDSPMQASLVNRVHVDELLVTNARDVKLTRNASQDDFTNPTFEDENIEAKEGTKPGKDPKAKHKHKKNKKK